MNRNLALARTVGLLWTLGACAHSVAPPLQVPAVLAQASDRFLVQGKLGLLKHTVRFGPYAAIDAKVAVERSNMEKPTQFNDQVERVEQHQQGSFTLVAPEGQRFAVECQKHRRLVTNHGDGVTYDPAAGSAQAGHVVSASDTFRCTIVGPSGSPIQMIIVQGAGGLVQAESAELTFLPVNDRADQPARTWKESSGFLIADGAREVAAVDLSDTPAVTLRRDLPAELADEVATVCMSLLLLRDMF